MSPQWHIQLLGGLRLRHGRQVVERLESRKAELLLAYLALHAGRPCARDILAEQLWPDEDPEATRGRLRQALVALRRALAPAPDVLGTDRSRVWLEPAAFTSDIAALHDALRAASQAETVEQRCEHLGRVLTLYQGDLLPGFYEEWVEAERARLADAHLDALLHLSTALVERGDGEAAIDFARKAVTLDPLREDAHRALMRACAASGRTAAALRQYQDLERLLRQELRAVPSEPTRRLFQELARSCAAERVEPVTPPSALAPEGRPFRSETAGGAVPLDSRFYIIRAADHRFREAVARRESLVLVKGPREVGKTSLLARGLQEARRSGVPVVLTDCSGLTAGQLASPDALFLTLAESIAEQLSLDLSPRRCWDFERGWNVNFQRYLRREVLTRTGPHLVWGLDEVDRLFHCPFRSEVFGLFRSWHNARSLDPEAPWCRLTLAMAYATEAHLFIEDLHQSPFNVGVRLTLEDFNAAEVAELNRRYGLPLRTSREEQMFLELVGGNPYLVRRGLQEMAEERLDFASFAARAEREGGLFQDQLRRLLLLLRDNPPLLNAMGQVLAHGRCPTEESFYRLRSAGVIRGDTMQHVRVRCGLYREYLRRHLAPARSGHQNGALATI